MVKGKNMKSEKMKSKALTESRSHNMSAKDGFTAGKMAVKSEAVPSQNASLARSRKHNLKADNHFDGGAQTESNLSDKDAFVSGRARSNGRLRS
jgi:hypothetical protein